MTAKILECHSRPKEGNRLSPLSTYRSWWEGVGGGSGLRSTSLVQHLSMGASLPKREKRGYRSGMMRAAVCAGRREPMPAVPERSWQTQRSMHVGDMRISGSDGGL